MRGGAIAEEELQLLGGLPDQRRRFCFKEVALVRVRAELGVGGEDDGDGACDGVTVAVPERKLLEQAAVAVRVVDEASSVLLQIILQRRRQHEVAVLPPKGLLPALRVEREILRRRNRRIFAAKQVDDKSDVRKIVGVIGFLIEPAKVRRSGGAVVAGEV